MFRLYKKLSFSIFLATLATVSCQTAFEPSNYDNLLTKTIESLEKRKKTVEDKVASLKKHSTQMVNTMQTVKTKAPQKTFSQQANQALTVSLTAALQDITDRIKKLQDEKNKIKNKTLTIKDKAAEDLLIKKAILQYSIDDISQKIQEALHSENFFANQKSGKRKQEQATFDRFKKVWESKRKKYEEKLRKERLALNSLK